MVDRHGNLVALTQTLLSTFGSKLLAPGTGLLLNNGIMWFDPRPGGPNAIAPGRQPLSNMCPVIGVHGQRRLRARRLGRAPDPAGRAADRLVPGRISAWVSRRRSISRASMSAAPIS